MVSGSVFLSDIGYYVSASMLALFLQLGARAAMSSELINIGWFAGVVAALALLFAAGLRLPVQIGLASRAFAATLVVTASLAIAILANVALFRHDSYLDLTREKAFTPSIEAREMLSTLKEPVDVAYFYQKQNPGARALTTMVSQLQRQNANLRLQLIDADQKPALASSLGVRTYNRPCCLSATGASRWSRPTIARSRLACCG